MKKEETAAYFQYKCRLCGEVFNSSVCSEELALHFLLGAISEKGPSFFDGFIGVAPKMVKIHSGCSVGCGVADLIGYIVK